MRRGFTLIEALIVIGILTFLTSLLLLYNRRGEEQILLFRDKAKMVNFLLRAKSLSVATFVGETSACGYGVHFELNRYILFRDLGSVCPGNHIYDSAEPQEIIESNALDSRLQFFDLGARDIFFLPPDPTVFFDGSPAFGEVKIGIKSIDGKIMNYITVSSAGQVSPE